MKVLTLRAETFANFNFRIDFTDKTYTTWGLSRMTMNEEIMLC